MDHTPAILGSDPTISSGRRRNSFVQWARVVGRICDVIQGSFEHSALLTIHSGYTFLSRDNIRVLTDRASQNKKGLQYGVFIFFLGIF